MTKQIEHFIGGKSVSGTSGRTGQVYNPSTGEVSGTVALASKADVEACIANGVELRHDHFKIGLEQTQLLSRECMETVLDRVVALDAVEIDLEQLKWVVLMVLFNRPGHEQLSLSVEHLFRSESAADLH